MKRRERAAQRMLALSVRSLCPNSPPSPCGAGQSTGRESSHSSGPGDDGSAEGTRLRVLCCSRALLPKYEQNTPLDTAPESTQASVMTCSASLGMAMVPLLSPWLS